jgi:hypothetical protein
MIEDDTHELMDEVHTLESRLSARPSGIYLSRPGISIRFGR